jgi:anaerobic ribonucleoside-triphosphate reductase
MQTGILGAQREGAKSTFKTGGRQAMAKCGAETEVYSRVTGYFRPVKNWNRGKREEFKDRKPYSTEMSTQPHTHKPREAVA